MITGQNYIDGEWVDGGAGRLAVTNPANGEVLAEQALADARDVDHAVQAARQLHRSGDLADMRPVDRGRMVQAMGRYLLDNLDQIAFDLTLEQGKPLWEARAEVQGAARCFEYFGNQAESLEGTTVPLGGRFLDFTVLEPRGISAQILPWTFPVEIAARSLAAALTAGNATILKPAEQTPLSSRWFALAAGAVGLQDGALNIVCGYGREAGAALAGHPDINHVTFTGSVSSGIAVAKTAALHVVPCLLDHGGTAAAIVHDDADLDAFVADVRWGLFYNAGQSGAALSRVMVHDSRHDELVDRVAEMADSLTVAAGIDGGEPGVTMGAMISETQRDRAEGMVTEAIAQGANLAAGGRRPKLPGAFYAPTVLVDVTPRMRVAQELVFGPVLSVQRFQSEDEAIDLANGTPYGHSAGVFTQSIDRAVRAARRLRAAQVFVNEWYAGGVETPSGGTGRSGHGRVTGREALLAYVQSRNVAIKVGS